MAKLIRASGYQLGTHLAEGDLLPPDVSCPLCLSQQRREPALLLQRDPEVLLLACRDCGGFSASRMPADATRVEYYAGYYANTRGAHVTGDPQALGSHIARRLRPLLQGARFSILDFGGGDGTLSYSLADTLLKGAAESVRVVVVDYEPQVRESFSPAISIQRAPALDAIAGAQFDVVLASAILEHIPYPRRELVQLLNAVRPGGEFYARTPTIAPLLRILRAFGVSCDFTYPAHVHDLGPAFWGRVLSVLPVDRERYRLISQGPSAVETAFRQFPLRTAAAYILKAPGYVFRGRYPFAGGWEVIFQRLR
jgi:SAM-dependent methyltransferase